MSLSDQEWKDKLTAEQYHILREKGTEAPFSGKYVNHDEVGNYVCSACGQILFESDTKFESTTPGLVGWPAFSDVANSKAVELVADNSLGMRRQEIICKRCGGHLGHYFDDPVSPNGKHYCVNSVCLDFKPKINK